MKKRLAGFSLLFFFFFSMVQAEESEEKNKFYVGVLGGGSFLSGPKVSLTTGDTNEEYDPGLVFSGFLGRRLDARWRVEVEAGYRKNTLDEVENKSTGVKVGGNGELDVAHLMFSLYHDFDVSWKVKPYIGAGIGYARVSCENKTESYTSIDSSDEVFACQGVLGVSYDWTENLGLFFDYRYFRTGIPKVSDASGRLVETECKNHSVNLGARIGF